MVGSMNCLTAQIEVYKFTTVAIIKMLEYYVWQVNMHGYNSKKFGNKGQAAKTNMLSVVKYPSI